MVNIGVAMWEISYDRKTVGQIVKNKNQWAR